MSTEWELQDAQDRFDEVFELAIAEGPQIVSRRGEQKVVVLAKEQYDRLMRPRGKLSEFMLHSPLAGSEINLERVHDAPPPSTELET